MSAVLLFILLQQDVAAVAKLHHVVARPVPRRQLCERDADVVDTAPLCTCEDVVEGLVLLRLLQAPSVLWVLRRTLQVVHRDLMHTLQEAAKHPKSNCGNVV